MGSQIFGMSRDSKWEDSRFTDTPLRRTLSVPPSVSVLKGVLLYLQSLALLIGANRVLKQWWRWRQRVRQESNGFRLAKQQLCTCIMLFCTFVSCRCMTTTWECLFFMFFQGREHKTTALLFISWTLIQSFRIQLQENLPTSDQFYYTVLAYLRPQPSLFWLLVKSTALVSFFT